jgi:hypothetical protein
MISLATVEYWPAAFAEFESTWSQHGIHSFERWIQENHNCRLSFSEFETSAAFVFDDEKNATVFILKYGKKQ